MFLAWSKLQRFLILCASLSFQLMASNTHPAASVLKPLEKGPSHVELKKVDGRWQMFRQQQPYTIKGVGGEQMLELLAQSKGNSIRTWHIDESTPALLDRAAALGLTVNVGLWIEHERHGFDYNDEKAVQKQFDYFKKWVSAIADHPAILMWGIGNEVQQGSTNPKVWDAINDISKMIHEVDKNRHPTTTILCWPSEEVMQHVNTRCQDLDMLGLNSYAGLKTSLSEAQKYGWNKATVVCEYGPDGHWESEKTPWGAYLEADSSRKAQWYEERTAAILDDPNCVGGYAFLWGEKQERTKTWYGLIFDRKHPTAGVDALAKAWSGQAPLNLAPKVHHLKVGHQTANDHITLSPNQEVVAHFKVSDDHSSTLRYTWELRHETTATSIGGDAESIPEMVKGVVLGDHNKASVTLRLPKTSGAYRLYAYAYDEQQKMAHANAPILVK